MGYIAEMQRKNLEQLMGAEAMGVVPVDTTFSDAKVCKNYLCGTCPHDLFTNTRMDLGQCPKLHSQQLKADYDNAVTKALQAEASSNGADRDAPPAQYSVKELENLKREYERNIIGFVEECDRRIRAAQRRLEKTPEENNRTTNLMREIAEIETAYQGAMQSVEQLGESGQIDESMAELAKAEALKAEKQSKERELQQLTENSGASGHQKLRVCDICGAYLSMLDSDRRLADHFGGKMHLGYLQLREMIEAWQERGINNVRLAPPTEAANGASAAAKKEEAPVAAPTGPKAEDGEVPAAARSSAPNGTGGSPPPAQYQSRSTSGANKRYSDLPEGAEGNRERDKRRRYD